MKHFSFLLAPDSFKGALSATQVCAALERGIRRAFSNAASGANASTRTLQITAIPLADGGEGTVEAFHRGAGGTLQSARVRNPLGKTVSAKWLRLPDGRAVLEMAQSSGLHLMPEINPLNALRASSFGLGETMRAALDFGCRELLIGVGGSATTDGGAGALQALGARFLDERSFELPLGGGALSLLRRVDLSNFDARLRDTKIKVLCDVTNPLLGENGAAQIFAPQKGAAPREVKILEGALSNFADAEIFGAASTRNENIKRDEDATRDKNPACQSDAPREKLGASTRGENAPRAEQISHESPRVSTRDSPQDLRNVPGAGAAGGAAFGLMRFCKRDAFARHRRGFASDALRREIAKRRFGFHRRRLD